MPRIDLCLLSTTDLHLALCPSGTGSDDSKHLFGLSRLIAEERQKQRNCLLFDNGDFLQGGVLGHPLTLLLERHPRRRHPMIAAMNMLGYDAAAIGNHEFDHGLPFLRRALRAARFPILCANLQLPKGETILGVEGWHILDRVFQDETGKPWPLRVGVFGVLPPLVTVWAREHLPPGTRCAPILDSAREAVAALRANGADLVVALCHSGLCLPGRDADDENLAHEVARLEGIDAVVAGHTHRVFPAPDIGPEPWLDTRLGTVHGTPLCLPGAEASHLGRITLTLAQDAAQGWRRINGRAEVLPAGLANDLPAPARDHKRRCKTLVDALAPYLAAPVGHSACDLSSHFALVRDCAATRLVARAMRDHLLGALRETLFHNIPVLGVASAQKCGGHGGALNYVDLSAGVLRERDLAALSPFPNRLHALLTTGAGVHDWLEHAAGVFATIHPGQAEQPLQRPEVPPFNFDIIEGLTYTIDLSVPPRFTPRGALANSGSNRIRDLRHQGKPVDPDSPFILAVNSFRSAGGGFFPGTGAGGAQILLSPPPMHEVLRMWLRRSGIYYAPPSALWRFAPIPGASVRFATGPTALRHLPIPGLQMIAAQPDGFVTMRLDLSPLASQHESPYVVA
jgi:2',3'-cyclic-nucleotide 2'-phosphodiesterase/3'-nucleotidase